MATVIQHFQLTFAFKWLHSAEFISEARQAAVPSSFILAPLGSGSPGSSFLGRFV